MCDWVVEVVGVARSGGGRQWSRAIWWLLFLESRDVVVTVSSVARGCWLTADLQFVGVFVVVTSDLVRRDGEERGGQIEGNETMEEREAEINYRD